MNGPDINFVNLGISIQNLQNNISVFGFKIAYYGMIIGLGMLVGIWIAQSDGKRRGQNPDDYIDFALYAIIFAIIGARAYYVAFEWDYYKENLMQIFNLRAGGLAIYGGVIASIITLIVYTKVKHKSFFSMVDSGILGLITGQIIGRWGNFFNCEAFGGYTDNLFAMRINKALVNANMLNEDVLSHLIVENGIEYIQVHPTFLYESMWNLGVLCFMLWYRNRKKFDGEMLWIYLFGYGMGRFWIEGLRTDQLRFANSTIAVSQVLSLVLVVAAGIILIAMHHKLSKERKMVKTNEQTEGTTAE